VDFLPYSIWWRKLFHKPIFGLLLRGHKFLRENNVVIIRNDFKHNGKPTIYTATHVFYNDISCIVSTIKDSMFLLYGGGGYGFFQKTSLPIADKIGLWLNGRIIIDRGNKASRQKALHKMVNVLNSKGNILIFPESSWNMSPNLPVKKLHWGLLDAAKQANANIVPVAVQRVGNDYCVTIGESFNYAEYPTKREQITILRDKMATLMWELIEMKPPIKRASINDDYWLAHVNDNVKLAPCNSYSEEESYDFKPKGEISLGELLAEMHGIEYESMAGNYQTHRHIERLITNWVTLRPLNKL
jgi:hypothetical protein